MHTRSYTRVRINSSVYSVVVIIILFSRTNVLCGRLETRENGRRAVDLMDFASLEIFEGRAKAMEK